MGEKVERSTTVFVDNLPHQIRKIWVYNLFSRFGALRNIFIPNKSSKITGQDFAFVRFTRIEDAEAAISNINNSWYWGQKLVVKFARFLKKDDTIDPQMSSYKNSFNSKPYQWKQIPQIHWKQNHQIHHSNLHAKKWPQNQSKSPEEKRGKEIWRRKGTTESSKHGEQRAKVNEAPTEVHMGRITVQPAGNGWLFRSAIAIMSRLVSTEDLEQVFTRERGIKVQIKAIGGRFVIITFTDVESRDSIIKEKWLTNWFEEIRPWKGEQAKEERFVWLSCYGMPLNAWSNTTFKEIGDKWGKFLQVDEATSKGSSYVQAKILIATNQFQKLNGYVDLITDEAIYPVRVMEDDSFRIIRKSFFDTSSEVLMEKNNAMVEDDNKAVNKDEIYKPTDVGSKNGSLVESNTDEEATSNSIVGMPPSLNEEAIVRDSMSSSLGIENTFLESDKVPDSLEDFPQKSHSQPKENNCLVHLDSEVMVNNSMVADGSGKEILNVKDNKDGEFFMEEQACNNVDVVNEEDHNLDHFEANQIPIQAAIKGIKGKRNRKSINEILGYTKVNAGNANGKRNKKKCVVLRSAIASAALSASISSGEINNRNRILLDEAQTIWAVDKLFGISYDGDEEEVISKIAEMEAQNKASANENH